MRARCGISIVFVLINNGVGEGEGDCTNVTMYIYFCSICRLGDFLVCYLEPQC